MLIKREARAYGLRLALLRPEQAITDACRKTWARCVIAAAETVIEPAHLGMFLHNTGIGEDDLARGEHFALLGYLRTHNHDT